MTALMQVWPIPLGVPVILGSGARLFDNLGDPKPRLEQVEAIDPPGVTHIRYARV
jgi:hypothetical protein